MTENEKSYGKLEIKLGNLSFTGEGDQNWLTEQLQNLIASADILNKTTTATPSHHLLSSASLTPDAAPQESLATYLKTKNADKNQNMRFLATADWLRRRGEQNLTSTLVSRALSGNHQARLANPSDCLNQNVKRGLCEKKPSGGFFISPEGLNILGY